VTCLNNQYLRPGHKLFSFNLGLLAQ
jgi:hypothetical protein